MPLAQVCEDDGCPVLNISNCPEKNSESDTERKFEVTSDWADAVFVVTSLLGSYQLPLSSHHEPVDEPGIEHA